MARSMGGPTGVVAYSTGLIGRSSRVRNLSLVIDGVWPSEVGAVATICDKVARERARESSFILKTRRTTQITLTMMFFERRVIELGDGEESSSKGKWRVFKRYVCFSSSITQSALFRPELF